MKRPFEFIYIYQKGFTINLRNLDQPTNIWYLQLMFDTI
jgi:hypothetical protein